FGWRMRSSNGWPADHGGSESACLKWLRHVAALRSFDVKDALLALAFGVGRGQAVKMPDNPRTQSTPLQRFERHILSDTRLNAKGRVLLQMKLLSRKQPFTMLAATQAKQLRINRWAVDEGR